MKIHALDLPEEPGQLAGWLERQLVDMDLGALVAELAAVHGDQPRPAESVRELLGPHLPAVLNAGLDRLPGDLVRRLLREPRHLFELQELVAREGGPYWSQVRPLSGRVDEAFANGQARLEGFLAAPLNLPSPTAGPVGEGRGRGARGPQGRRSPARKWYTTAWFAALGAAASVLVAAALYQQFRTPAPQAGPGWGWNRAGALPADASASAYLNALADAAEDWFKKRPAEAAPLAQRIQEFRQGCSRLIFAEHRPLGTQREWLVGKCREWAVKLDSQLEDLEAGKSPPPTVRNNVDEIVNKLVAALRKKAQEV
jgi:hypothetical protein